MTALAHIENGSAAVLSQTRRKNVCNPAHNPRAQAIYRTVRLPVTEQEAARWGIIPRWQAAWERKERRESQKRSVSNRLNSLLNQLAAIATSNGWSQRKLAAKVDLPESTWRKLRAGRTPRPAAFIPKLETALERFTNA